MVACEECSLPQVTGLRWYHWLELRSRWRRQQYSHFDTACQRPKGKLHFLFAVMIPPSAARYFRRHLPAMSIKTTLHATAPLLYPCRRYPKCPWGLYASRPPVAMAVVGWFLCFPAFFLEKWVFFPHTRLTPRKKKFTRLTPKKKISVEKKTRLTPKKKKLRDLRQKKNKKATYAYFHNRVTLSSPLLRPIPMSMPPSLPLPFLELTPLPITRSSDPVHPFRKRTAASAEGQWRGYRQGRGQVDRPTPPSLAAFL